MPAQMLCAREFANEHLRFVNQHWQTLRANVRLSVAMFDGDERHLFNGAFTVHTMFFVLMVVHFLFLVSRFSFLASGRHTALPLHLFDPYRSPTQILGHKIILVPRRESGGNGFPFALTAHAVVCGFGHFHERFFWHGVERVIVCCAVKDKSHARLLFVEQRIRLVYRH